MTASALILASGQGTRMAELSKELGLPKHLFPLPSSETIVGRIVKSLEPLVDQVIVTVSGEHHVAAFEQTLRPLSPGVQIVVKEPSEFEYSEVGQVRDLIKGDVVVHTNGDLVFADHALEAFVENNIGRGHMVLGREGNPANKAHPFDIFNIRASVVPTKELMELVDSPNRKCKVASLFLKTFLLGRVGKIETVANVDTPADYDLAKAYFTKEES